MGTLAAHILGKNRFRKMVAMAIFLIGLAAFLRAALYLESRNAMKGRGVAIGQCDAPAGIRGIK